MSELTDTIQESVENAGKSTINSRVAIFVSIAATFMALCNVKDGNIVQAMSQAQAHSIDAWSYFQAKSTKQSLAENSLKLLNLEPSKATDSIKQQFQNEIKRYETEKAKIKTEAEDYQKEYDEINLFDDQFDMTEALLT